MQRGTINYYHYAKEEEEKWNKLIGYKVKHYNSKIGKGTIVSFKKKGSKVITLLHFNESTYDDGRNDYEIQCENLEDFCFIENLKKNKEYASYVKINNGIFPVKQKKKLVKPITTRKEEGLIVLRKEDCVKAKKLLQDIEYDKEADNLKRTLNFINAEVYDLNQEIDEGARNNKYTYSPTASEMLDMAEQRETVRRKKKIKEEIIQIIGEPYFVRTDINDMKIYVGKRDFKFEDKTIIHDWRSELGERYRKKTELKFKIDGEAYEVKLIRNFLIKDSKLCKYYDEKLDGEKIIKKEPQKDMVIKYNEETEENITVKSTDEKRTADPFLVKVLKSKRNIRKMTHIISTIQENQDKIITKDLMKNYIVQGCAGSGKTMLLLHRLSYLLYNHKELERDKIRIITPNNNFKDHINTLSQDLDIQGIEMKSIEEYFMEKICEYDVSIKENAKNTISREAVSKSMIEYFSSDLFFSELKERYGQVIDNIFNGIKDDSLMVMANKYKIDHKFSLDKRLLFNELKVMISDLRISVKDEIKRVKEFNVTLNGFISNGIPVGSKDVFIKSYNYIEDLCNKLNIRLDKSQTRQRWSLMGIFNLKNNNKSIEDRANYLYSEKVCENILKSLKKLQIKVNSHYKILNDDNNLIKNKIYYPFRNSYKEQGIDTLGNTYWFDLVGMLYISYIHKGALISSDRLLFIDEGQDLSENEYKIIKLINNNINVNIYGDEKQRLTDKSIPSWEGVKDIFNAEIDVIKENYRNADIITDFCVKSYKIEMTPIGLDDGKIELIDFKSYYSRGKLDYLKESKDNSKAIILKEYNEENKRRIKSIFPYERVNFISEYGDKGDEGKLNVYTVEMAKGLEFNIVLVMMDNMTLNERYVATTRAMRECYIIE